jgi:hypothetical protein
MRSILAVLALSLAGVLPGVAAAANGAPVCGGIGSDERRELAARAADANLSLEMFIETGGEYIADVKVAIVPADSRARPVTLTTDGPVCFLQVPPGRYRIEATFSGIRRSAEAIVPARGRKHVALAFPKSVGDRQTDAASPEEKQQAKRIP